MEMGVNGVLANHYVEGEGFPLWGNKLEFISSKLPAGKHF